MNAARKNRSFKHRVMFALSGIIIAWKTEASFRTQSLAVVMIFFVLLWLKPSPIWWALIITLCAAVLAAELFNTALEALIDHIHPEIHPSMGRAKDCAAGAVLLLSFAAILSFVALLVHTFF